MVIQLEKIVVKNIVVTSTAVDGQGGSLSPGKGYYYQLLCQVGKPPAPTPPPLSPPPPPPPPPF
jgi:hypothetical protein